ncbi:cytochrome d ubiquinol oxidase subunit II [Rugosimonospora africana]|uniref:Cytochrome c oxidase assembly protein n=1 Tax=Rugosimonospora africana TaxID=556532 RepID=A0A8J3R0M2_9ACTN|nr:cytochrome d ubiquinol oxidase subunit II [Rugosimonospora africana]GIH20824.1 cytochrome c oxidase assembly protein [Rugosimonospora africana]
MHLTTAWFTVIAFLWTGYFVLEGFDFGVGVLAPLLGRDEPQRGALLHTIGPVWDGNEVWVITAVGATFAAFPDWYASLTSGFYLPLVLIILALIVRGVALEYRGKRPEPVWRKRADIAIAAGSLLPALGWGAVIASMVHGVPMDAAHTVTGGAAWILRPTALLGAATFLALFATHGALFLALKTTGALRTRARTVALRVGPLTVALLAAFLAWMVHPHRTGVTVALAVAALACLAGGIAATVRGRDGWAFTGTAATVALTLAALFATLYPDVLPSTPNPANSLTVAGAASSPYTLTIMSWAAAVFAPLVLVYQGWTYWVFRRRITLPATASPAAPASPAGAAAGRRG